MSLISAEQENSDAKLVEEAKKISICFVNTTNSVATMLSHIQLKGGKGLLPVELNLNPGHSRIFEVFYPLEENEDRLREIVFSYFALEIGTGSNT